MQKKTLKELKMKFNEYWPFIKPISLAKTDVYAVMREFKKIKSKTTSNVP